MPSGLDQIEVRMTDSTLPLGTVLEHPCAECGAPMELRSSKFGLFYGCTRYPECQGKHGAHKNGQPLGIPADKETKRARMDAHETFDTLWKGGQMSRSFAYQWMQEQMGLSSEEAHIGRFTIEQCRLLQEKVWAFVTRTTDTIDVTVLMEDPETRT